MTEKPHPNHPGELGTDRQLAEKLRDRTEIEARARAIQLLEEAGVQFVVGGAYAYCQYTGIYRDTKDLDLFLRKRDAGTALGVLAQHGWRTERTDEVWLYKGFHGEYFVDLIFCSGNGVAQVDDEWFEHATPGETFGRPVLVAPPEEMIWSKAFVLERERYDGGDVNHIIRAVGDQLDWNRLLRRFDRHWEVLLSHLMLYRFVYPTHRTKVPDWVMAELICRTLDTVRQGDCSESPCRGPLVSRVNYQLDIREGGCRNGQEREERERRRGGARFGAGSEFEDSSRSSG